MIQERLLSTENRPTDLKMGRALVIFEQFQNSSWSRNDNCIEKCEGDKVETGNHGFSFKKFRVREREIRQQNKDHGRMEGRFSLVCFLLVRLEKTTESLIQVYFRYQVLTSLYMPKYTLQEIISSINWNVYRW